MFHPSRFSSSPDEGVESRGIDLNQDAHFSDSPVLRRSAGTAAVEPTQLFGDDETDAAYVLGGMAADEVRFDHFCVAGCLICAFNDVVGILNCVFNDLAASSN